LVLERELDRILDRDDVRLSSAVDVVDERGERRRLPGPRRTGNENESFGQSAEAQDLLRQTERLDGNDLSRSDEENRAQSGLVDEKVRAESAHSLELVSEVRVATPLELLASTLRDDGPDDLLERRRRQRRAPIHRTHLTVHADHRTDARAEVQIRCAKLRG